MATPSVGAGLSRGVENVPDQPKITGLSFNIFAIVGLLVILPISVAFVTNLANSNAEDNTSIINDNLYEIDNGQVEPFLKFLDVGQNMTQQYEQEYNTNDPYLYESIWNQSKYLYQYAVDSRSQSYTQTVWINGDPFKIGADNHRFVNQNYIGYSGDSFEFLITENLTSYIDDSKDISNIELLFVDWTSGFDCDSNIFQDIEFKGDLILQNDIYTLSLNNFDFNVNNSYYNPFDYQSSMQSAEERCHIALRVNFELTPFESIELNDLFTNYDNLSMNVKLYDFDFDTNFSNLQQSPIAFAGDEFFAFDFRIGYVDTVRTNFFLNGGTFIMGVSLFALAISSTPYWNPVVGFLKPKGA